MSAAWLLPIVSSIVAAASGGVVASEIMPFFPSLARSTVLVSYVIWGTGVPLACFVMALWLYRTAVHGVPAPAALPSVFLPLGPCGQGSFGIILLGRTIRQLAYVHDIGMTIAAPGAIDAVSIFRVADAVYAGGLVTGMVLWGLGLCWYILASAMILDHLRKDHTFFHHSKFSVGLWALTFPLGVFATATNILATELDSPAFKVIGAFLSVQVMLHWIYVSVMTLYKVWNGTVFVAPELVSFKGVVPRRFGQSDGPQSVV
jgi:tellurite resistance protein TehA-like permease